MPKAGEVQDGGGLLAPQALACFGLAGLLGLAGLAGNLLDLPRLAGLGVATAAMSLRSALVLVLLTGGLALERNRRPWLGRTCLGLALALTALSCLPGAGMGLQALFSGRWGTRQNSLLSATAALSQGLALLVATSAVRPGRWARQAAAVLGLLAAGIGAVTLIGTLAGVDQLYSQHLQPMSCPAALAFGAMGLGTLLAAGDDTWPLALFRPAMPGGRRYAPASLGVFLAAALGVAFGGAFLLHGQLAAARTRALGELTAIAGGKAATLTAWYRDRDQDARQIFLGPQSQRLLQEGLRGNRGGGPLQAWLDAARLGAYRRVLLFDAAGQPRAASPAGEPFALSEAGRAGLERALRASAVQVQDLHRDPDSGELVMGWWIPVGARAGQPCPGALLMQLDPRQFLYPLLQSWPVAQSTAETMLVRREGGEVRFLNELRHRPDAALSLRLPVADDGGLPGKLAALGGNGMVRGRDYRGVQVLATLTRLTGTPWALVVKVDEAEIYGSLRLAAWTAGTVILATLGAMALLFGLVVRQRDAEHFATRIRLEQDKRALADRYANLMDQASDAILVVDLAGRILEANETACQLYGRSIEELRALTLMDLRVPEEQGEFPAQFSQVRSGASVRYETRHQRADGTVVPVEITAREVLFGTRATILAFVRDASARKAQEAELRRRLQLYDALAQVNQAIVMCRDRQSLLERICEVMVEQGRFSLAWIGWRDPVTKAVTVAASHAAPGATLELKPGPDGTLPGPLGVALRTGGAWIVNLRQDGAESRAWQAQSASAGAFPIRCQGQVVGALSVHSAEEDFFSFQELAILEEAAGDLSFALDRLELEAERARDAEEKRQLQAEVEHMQKLDSLGRLAGGVAHDLNNVLAAIYAVNQTIRAGQQGPELLEALDTVDRAATRGRDLVRKLLGFSRKSLAATAPLDLNELVRQEMALLERTLQQKFHLALDLEQPLPAVLGDGGALSGVIMNLCVNAVDAMAEGGTLTLRTRRAAGFVELTVADTGAGMAPEVLRRALEPFYTTKPLGQGTGLGLSLAFSTAQAHGGSLSLSSEAGRGTQVLLRLPALEEGAAPPPAAEPRPAVPEGRELLLVDDDELIRATVPRLLHLRGHRVAAVDSGEAALARLGQGLVPDVMILDLNMPDLGGLETLRRLRATHPRLPVLLASGFLDAATEAAVVADPHLLAITKPFSLDEIQDMLGRFDQT